MSDLNVIKKYLEETNAPDKVIKAYWEVHQIYNREDDLSNDIGVFLFAGMNVDKRDAESLRTTDGIDLYNLLRAAASEYRADTFVFEDALRQILESSDMDEIKTIVVSVMPQYDLESQLEAVKARIERGAKLAGWSHGFDEKGELHPSLADLQSLPVIDEYYRLKKEIAIRDQS